jgi:hypothetical protein
MRVQGSLPGTSSIQDPWLRVPAARMNPVGRGNR